MYVKKGDFASPNGDVITQQTLCHRAYPVDTVVFLLAAQSCSTQNARNANTTMASCPGPDYPAFDAAQNPQNEPR
jgi:uncharacterized protein YraI